MTPDDLLADLRALCAGLHPGTSVALTDLQTGPVTAGQVTVDLGLHLVWAPGERRMPYTATAPDTAQALAVLRDRIVADLIVLHRPLNEGPPRSGEKVCGRRT